MIIFLLLTCLAEARTVTFYKDHTETVRSLVDEKHTYQIEINLTKKETPQVYTVINRLSFSDGYVAETRDTFSKEDYLILLKGKVERINEKLGNK